ncbi:MAG TPA: hypothetical protein VHB47_00755 [Thermoanaerobaculia bacterium]|jgi:hypothetical protein|nr:hypothetical protein [Thermoanaerobaculia bacterium]
MKTRLAIAALLTLSSVVTMPGMAQSSAAPPPVGKRPVLSYLGSGGFPPIGSVALLTVYSNGQSVLDKIGARHCEAAAAADQVSTLQARLAAAGAFYLGDGPSPGADEQDITLTYFVPVGSRGRARSNSFSYTLQVQGPYAEVEKAVEDFIAAVFPDC